MTISLSLTDLEVLKNGGVVVIEPPDIEAMQKDDDTTKSFSMSEATEMTEGTG